MMHDDLDEINALKMMQVRILAGLIGILLLLAVFGVGAAFAVWMWGA